MRPKGLHLPQKHEPKLLALPAQANRYFRRRLRLVALACGLALRECVGFTYPFAIATSASTFGIDHAQSPSNAIAAAATRKHSRKPSSRRGKLYNRPESTDISGCGGNNISISNKTALVRLPVITAVETAFGKAKRRRAY